MATVECVDLSRVFDLPNGGKEVAVDSINATIEEGEFATVVGPSGCGKTTFLRMIAGLETPTSGQILFDGNNIVDKPPQERNLSMVFQDIALFPFKTVEQNIKYGLKYAGVDNQEIDRRTKEMAEMVGIEELLNKQPPQLSGGQQQRAALARALIRNPEVFLLDEPLSDLDAKLKSKMRTELKELHQKLPQTTIYVTHDQVEAMTLSDSVIVMNEGQIMQKSAPNEVYSRPKNTFVAQFIGSPSINLFDTTVRDSNIAAEELNCPIPITTELRNSVTTGDGDAKITIGVRPNNIRMVDPSEDPLVTGSVRVHEQMGDENIVYVETSVGNELRVSVPSDEQPEQGEEFHMSFSYEDIHLFDRPGGEAIRHGLVRPE